ncbi:MAG: hypothetical protein IT349_00760 [Candidatus Eisenbacteria bacterium]|nr:hypothetical protein [Candidatus Eisenbacteria bacterium]
MGIRDRSTARLAATWAITIGTILACGAGSVRWAAAQPPPLPLPPVPVPVQNPITEQKRVLGKILFFEEQLSFDNSVACGTCHQPGAGSADARSGRHPGRDAVFFTADDVLGSAGVRRADQLGHYETDPIFGEDAQVTSRTTPGFLGTLWAPELFWDGRARQQFEDPEGGGVLIPIGGALENQALGPILNSVEMAHASGTWEQVREKLALAPPLALATDLPSDVATAIAAHPSYPALFAAAFGDPEISAARIAYAIATYERTLVPDETPWDRFIAGDNGAMTQRQVAGWNAFRAGPCATCHTPPFFSDHTFRNIGLRPIVEDNGRQAVTGQNGDRGRFKVPSLRNVGLRPRLMHNGMVIDVRDAFGFYTNPGRHFPENQDPIVQGGLPLPPPNVLTDIVNFLENGLTDPRVAAETFPFDRPTLRSELPPSAVDLIELVSPVTASPNPFRGVTVISFASTPRSPRGALIYNALGAEVRRLSAPDAASGEIGLTWDGRDDSGRPAAPGVYFIRVDGAKSASAARVIRVR